MRKECQGSKERKAPQYNAQRMRRERKTAVSANAQSSTRPQTVAGFKSDVQCGHLAALIGMLVAQKRHSVIEGASGSGLRFIRFICRTTRKMAKATIRKSTTVPRNAP